MIEPRPIFDYIWKLMGLSVWQRCVAWWSVYDEPFWSVEQIVGLGYFNATGKMPGE